MVCVRESIVLIQFWSRIQPYLVDPIEKQVYVSCMHVLCTKGLSGDTTSDHDMLYTETVTEILFFSKNLIFKY